MTPQSDGTFNPCASVAGTMCATPATNERTCRAAAQRPNPPTAGTMRWCGSARGGNRARLIEGARVHFPRMTADDRRHVRQQVRQSHTPLVVGGTISVARQRRGNAAALDRAMAFGADDDADARCVLQTSIVSQLRGEDVIAGGNSAPCWPPAAVISMRCPPAARSDPSSTR